MSGSRTADINTDALDALTVALSEAFELGFDRDDADDLAVRLVGRGYTIRRILDANASEAARTPHALWEQAGGDRDEYLRLMREHGHLIPGKRPPGEDIFGHAAWRTPSLAALDENTLLYVRESIAGIIDVDRGRPFIDALPLIDEIIRLRRLSHPASEAAPVVGLPSDWQRDSADVLWTRTFSEHGADDPLRDFMATYFARDDDPTRAQVMDFLDRIVARYARLTQTREETE